MSSAGCCCATACWHWTLSFKKNSTPDYTSEQLLCWNKRLLFCQRLASKSWKNKRTWRKRLKPKVGRKQRGSRFWFWDGPLLVLSVSQAKITSDPLRNSVSMRNRCACTKRSHERQAQLQNCTLQSCLRQTYSCDASFCAHETFTWSADVAYYSITVFYYEKLFRIFILE